MTLIDYLGPFLLLLGVLVVIHELGHFGVAKWFGVKVERFAVGFGPSILRRRIGETEYVLAWLPLGGYVKMAGESPDDELSPEDRERSFLAQSPLRRTLIALAGPGMNLLLSVVVIAGLLISGWPTPTSRVGSVQPQSAAAEAGLLPGDVIVAVDGREIWRWIDLTEAIRKSGGKSLALVVARGDGRVETSITPRSGDYPGYRIGVEARRLLAVVGVHDPDSAAARAGLLTGDRITRVGERGIADWYELARAVERAGPELALEVERRLDDATEKVSLRVDRGASGEASWSLDALGLHQLDSAVELVEPVSPAKRAGVEPGDLIVGLGGEPVTSFAGLEDRVQDSGGAPVVLELLRAGREHRVQLEPALRRVTRDGETEEIWVTGIHAGAPRGPGELREDRVRNPLVALWRGTVRTAQVFYLTIDGIRQLITREVGVESLAGPIGIGEIAGDSFAEEGWFQFLWTMCWISVNLAIINLLPIPILDGGHIIFAAAEAVRGAPLSLRAREIAQTLGLSFIILLMGFAFWNDISRNWTNIVGFFENLL